MSLNCVVVCVSGISGKSQILFALVFTTRYLDLLTAFISLYNSFMKVNLNILPLKTCTYSCLLLLLLAV